MSCTTHSGVGWSVWRWGGGYLIYYYLSINVLKQGAWDSDQNDILINGKNKKVSKKEMPSSFSVRLPSSQCPSKCKLTNTIYRETPGQADCALLFPPEETVCARDTRTLSGPHSAQRSPSRRGAEVERRLRSCAPGRPRLRYIPHTAGFAQAFPSDVQCPP